VNTTYAGIKASVLFPDGSDDCDRVSSVGAINGDGEVEIGWTLGWLPRDGNVYTGSGACNDIYFVAPQVFEVWVPIGGDYHCRMFGSDTHGSNTFHTVSTANNAGGGDWQTNEGGMGLDHVIVNFNSGIILTNAERHNLSIDTAKAHFKSLKKKVAGDTTWFDFCCSVKFADTDSDFHWVRDSATETEVLHD
jgi:hypothetical protein